MAIFNIWHGNPMPKFYFLTTIILLFLIQFKMNGQAFKEIKLYESKLQFSLFPGVSTNGIDTWNYNNKFSFNLFGGLSAGNKHFEIGGITNINLYGTTGIQIAGLANIVGANAYVNLTTSERRATIKEGFEINTTAIQFAGFINFTRNNATGIQIAGGMNSVLNNFTGFQAALISNAVGHNTFGTQIGGLFNLTLKSTTGLQLSSIYNKTRLTLYGIQISLFNSAKKVTGKKSVSDVNTRSVQIGLINFSKQMEGLQIGLINFGGATVGTQIGLINFFSNQATKKQTTNGTPIGLINMGSTAPILRVHTNELFLANFEITTGNCSNCTFSQSGMPYNQSNKKYNQNALILGINSLENIWGFGYGFQKLLLNKFDMTGNPKNGKRIVSYGLQLQHLNTSGTLEKAFNLLTKLHFEYGKRKFGLYFFGGISINLYVDKPTEETKTYLPNNIKSWSSTLLGYNGSIWLGYSFGIQL